MHTIRVQSMRSLRARGHALFDPLWRSIADPDRGIGFGDAREMAYQWLSWRLGITRGHAHFASMSREQLTRAIEILEHARPSNITHYARDISGIRVVDQDGVSRRSAPLKRIGIASAVRATLDAAKGAR